MDAEEDLEPAGEEEDHEVAATQVRNLLILHDSFLIVYRLRRLQLLQGDRLPMKLIGVVQVSPRLSPSVSVEVR